MSKAAELIEMLAAGRQPHLPLTSLVEALRAADQETETAIADGDLVAMVRALGHLRNIVVMLSVASANVDAVKRSPIP